MNEFAETGILHFLLIDNLEKDLSALTISEFIYKQTSVSSQAYVFPSRSPELYARGAIVSECKMEIEKIYHSLNNSDQLIVSAKGRYFLEFFWCYFHVCFQYRTPSYKFLLLTDLYAQFTWF